MSSKVTVTLVQGTNKKKFQLAGTRTVQELLDRAGTSHGFNTQGIVVRADSDTGRKVANTRTLEEFAGQSLYLSTAVKGGSR